MENKTQIWTTFQGKEILISEMDHQHLSNVFYYFKLILKMKPPGFIEIELQERFNGQILDYKPHINFKQEFNYLIKDNLINVHNFKENKLYKLFPIKFEGNEIGHFCIPKF